MEDLTDTYQNLIFQVFSVLKIKLQKISPQTYDLTLPFIESADQKLSQFSAKIYSLTHRHQKLQKQFETYKEQAPDTNVQLKYESDRAIHLQKKVNSLTDQNLIMSKFTQPVEGNSSVYAVQNIIQQNQLAALQAERIAAENSQKSQNYEKLCHNYYQKISLQAKEIDALREEVAEFKKAVKITREGSCQTDIFQQLVVETPKAQTLKRQIGTGGLHRSKSKLDQRQNVTQKLPVCKLQKIQIVNFDF